MKEHYSKEAEMDLISAVMRQNSIFDEVQVSPEAFQYPENQAIWTAFVSIRGAGHPIGRVTLFECLSRLRHNDVRADYVADLADRAGDLTSAKACARIINRHAATRAIIEACAEITSEADSQAMNVDELTEFAERSIFAVADKGIQGQVANNESTTREALEILQRRMRLHRRGEMIGSIPYGLRDLDKATAGMHGGELVIIAARPGVGKTIFGCHIADVVSAAGMPALFVSLEQARHELALRLLAKHGNVNAFKIRSGTVSDVEFNDLEGAAHRIEAFPLWWDDNPMQTVGRIAAQARRLKAKKGLQLVVVDYMQLIESANKRAKRHEQVGEMSRALKLLARDLQIPVVVMAQLNRDSESQNREPRLSDLRESGNIEQDADTVILLHLPNKIDAEQKTQDVQCLIRKQRNGPIIDVFVRHDKAHYALVSAADEGPPTGNWT